jgi:amino acid transporter
MLPVLLLLILFFIFWSFKAKSIEGQSRRLVLWLQGIALGLGAVVLCLWFLLPMTPTLSTFGYPEKIEQIDSPEETLRYLQGMNRALVRTIDVLHLFLFLFIWIFLAAIYGLSKLIAKEMDRKSGSELSSEPRR